MGWGRVFLCGVIAVASAGSARATQIFNFVSGQAHVTANVVGSSTFLVDEVLPLDGTFVDFNPSPVAVPDFQISIAPSGSIMMSGSYGGYDTISIDSVLLTPGTGYSSSGSDLGSGQYSVTMGPVDVNAVYSASDSTLTNPPVSGVPISFTNASLNSTVNTNLVTFEMMGVTLGIIPGSLVGETNDLIVKGDITFVGVVPEPSTGALLGLGLLGLAGSRRKYSLRRSVGHC